MTTFLALCCIALICAVAEWPRIFVYRILLRSPDFGARHHPVEASPGGWREVLGLPESERRIAMVKKAYRRKARLYHPDRGGSTAAMAKLNEAYRTAKEELGAG